MRILLDENLDWRLGRDLPGHSTESVPLIGWAGIENGELLAKAAEARFDVLLTMDQELRDCSYSSACALESIGRHSSAHGRLVGVAAECQAGHSNIPSGLLTNTTSFRARDQLRTFL